MGFNNIKKYVDKFWNKFQSQELECIKQLLNKNYNLATEIAMKLYSKSPQYLTLLTYITREKSNKIFLIMLKKYPVIDMFLIELVLKDQGFLYKDIADNITISLDKVQLYHLHIQKEILFKKYGYKKPKTIYEYCESINTLKENNKAIESSLEVSDDCLMRIVSNNFGNNKNNKGSAISVIVNNLIKAVNDFSLYDFAMKQGVIVEKNDSMNYKWYELMMNKDIRTGIEILKNSIDFNEIHAVYRICNGCITELRNIDILMKYLSEGYEEWMIKEMVNIYEKEKSLFNLKIVLALLISSRVESNLVLALYLASKEEISENYEITLIRMFLNRYFCFIDEVLKLFEELNIKNIQCYNMAYLWTDPMIVCGMSLDEKKKSLKKCLIKDLANLNLQIHKFMNQKQIGCAISVIEIDQKLKNMVIWKELDENKIIGEDPNTLFSMMLGNGCSFLFNKLVVNDSLNETNVVGSLFAKTNNEEIENIFRNPFIEITDQYFITNFKKAYYNKRKKHVL